MAPRRYFTLNTVSGVSETDPSNVIIDGPVSETKEQAASRLMANPSTTKLSGIPGPANMSLEVDCNVSARTILFKGYVPDGTTLRIETVSGNTYQLANAQNPTLNMGVDYPFGPYSVAGSELNANWAFGPKEGVSNSGVPSERLFITLKDSSGNKLVTVAFTPSTVTGKKLFTKSASSTPTQTTALFTSTNGFNSIYSYKSGQNGGQLQILGSGSGAYELSFEGVDQSLVLSNNDSPTPGSIPTNTFLANGPSGNPTYSYDWSLYGVTPGVPLRVKVRKDGGSPDTFMFTPSNASNQAFTSAGLSNPTPTQTASPTATTTGIPTVTLKDAEGFLIYSDQGWSGADEKQIENGQMLMKFKRSVGACPTWVSLKSDGLNLCNDEQTGPSGARFSDKGCQWQFSAYSSPVAFAAPYVIGGRGEMGTGANPVQGGSTAPYYGVSPVEKSAIVNDPERGVVFCARVRGLIWNFPYEPGHIPVDFEYWFMPDQTIGFRCRSNVEDRGSRVPEQRTWQAISQELPCLYNIGDLNLHRSKLNGQELDLRAGTPMGQQGRDYFTDGCWSGSYTQDRSKGVTLYTPQNAIHRSWQKHAEQGQWMDTASGYINAGPKRNFDIPGRYIDYGYIILGGYNFAQNRLATLPAISQEFDFDFSQSNNSWWNEDSRLQRDPGTGLMKWFLGDEKVDGGTYNYGRFLSPVRAWKASEFRCIEITMAVHGTNRLNLKYARPGEFDSVNSLSQISVNGDGVERAYTFDVPWGADNSLISYVGMTAITPTPSNAYAIVRRIRKV
ncbi:hypothetical protein [Spirosoma fluviale]|uniref:Uncharacterized protein n=1 Tax=Spirosoma fluviale TaxID=1597977 RepID=A0A286FCR1_9BACT|nr:hypothetical protein [Spirosoma fluviale]SOD81025.1 hypothetical protein SAMN06269250_1649 [Spirosoma fluviale]